MDNRRNYYRILHLQPDAPVTVIKASYRTQMHQLRYHPDLGGDEQNAVMINQAYATLTNTKKRAAYDAMFRNHDQSRNAKKTFRNKPATLALQLPCKSPRCLFCGRDHTEDNNSNTCLNCDSPFDLSTAHLLSNDSGSRTLHRQLLNKPVKYFSRASSPVQIGIILDLSPTGLQFQLSEPLSNTQIIKLACDALTAIVRVKYCRQSEADGLYDVGVEFLTSRFSKQCGTFFSAVAT